DPILQLRGAWNPNEHSKWNDTQNLDHSSMQIIPEHASTQTHTTGRLPWRVPPTSGVTDSSAINQICYHAAARCVKANGSRVVSQNVTTGVCACARRERTADLLATIVDGNLECVRNPRSKSDRRPIYTKRGAQLRDSEVLGDRPGFFRGEIV